MVVNPFDRNTRPCDQDTTRLNHMIGCSRRNVLIRKSRPRANGVCAAFLVNLLSIAFVSMTNIPGRASRTSRFVTRSADFFEFMGLY